MAQVKKLRLNSPVGADPLVLKWPVATSEGKEGPEEILDSIRLVCDDYPELKNLLNTKILKDGEDVANFDFAQTKAMCERFNKTIETLREQAKITRQKKSKIVTSRQLKHILQQAYNCSVKDPERLNHYEPFSPEVYGETSFELVEQMIKSVKFTENDYFIDLGSGVGQVVLQVAAATNCKFCYGVEKADWPAQYAVGMEKEFRRWMKWYGKSYGDFLIEKGDFLVDNVKDKLAKATIVFVNNFAFGPQVDHELKQRFADCLKEGARIVSSKAFCPLNFRITSRNLSDIGTMMKVEELSPLCGAVSWTGKAFAYYVHTIDRTLLEKYFDSLKNPNNKKDETEARKDRKGRPMLSIKDKIDGGLQGGSAADIVTHDRAKQALGRAKKKKMKSIKRLNNGALGKRKMQAGRRRERSESPPPPIMSKAAAKQLRPEHRKIRARRTRSSELDLDVDSMDKKTTPAAHVMTSQVSTTAPVSSEPRVPSVVPPASLAPPDTASVSIPTTTASSSRVVSSPSSSTSVPAPLPLDSLNLLHAHTVMSTSGKDTPERVSYNDKRMAESSNAFFKPSLQQQTVSMLGMQAGFLNMIENIKQRYLSFMAFMQTPQYRAMLSLQIEQEKQKNMQLKETMKDLEKDISALQKEGVGLIKERLMEIGIKTDSPKELLSQHSSLTAKNKELLAQSASLGNEIENLQTTVNYKIASQKKIQDRKSKSSKNGRVDHNFSSTVDRLSTELQHLQNVNKTYVGQEFVGHHVFSPNPDKAAQTRHVDVKPVTSSIDLKEKIEIQRNYNSLGNVLHSLKSESTVHGHKAKGENKLCGAGSKSACVESLSRVTSDLSLSNDVPSSNIARNSILKKEPDNEIQPLNPSALSFKTPNMTVRNILATGSNLAPLSTSSANSNIALSPSTHMYVPPSSLTSSSWTPTEVKNDPNLSTISPRILPPGTKILDMKRSRSNGLKNPANNSKRAESKNFTALQNSTLREKSSPFNTDQKNGYTDSEKSAAEDLILLKEGSSPQCGTPLLLQCTTPSNVQSTAPILAAKSIPVQSGTLSASFSLLGAPVSNKNSTTLEHSYCEERTAKSHIGSISSNNIVFTTTQSSNYHNTNANAIPSSMSTYSYPKYLPSSQISGNLASLLMADNKSQQSGKGDKSRSRGHRSTSSRHTNSIPKHKSTDLSSSQPNNKVRCIEGKDKLQKVGHSASAVQSMLLQPSAPSPASVNYQLSFQQQPRGGQQVILNPSKNVGVIPSVIPHTSGQQVLLSTQATAHETGHQQTNAALTSRGSGKPSTYQPIPPNMVMTTQNGIHNPLLRVQLSQQPLVPAVMLSHEPTKATTSSAVSIPGPGGDAMAHARHPSGLAGQPVKLMSGIGEKGDTQLFLVLPNQGRNVPNVNHFNNSIS